MNYNLRINYTKIYLLILPIYSVAAIYFSAIRTAIQENYAFTLLVLIFSLDIILLLINFRKGLGKGLALFIFLLTISLILGMLQNEISRRTLSDFLIPIIFFAKVNVFKHYFKRANVEKYLKYCVKISFWGSLFFLPYIYFIFNSNESTRLAIFPPMELPLSYYYQTNNFFMLLSFFIILLYGKRAQLVGAIVTFLFFIYKFRSSQFIRYIILFIFILFVFNLLSIQFSNNLAIRRITKTFELISTEEDGLEKASSGRSNEIMLALSNIVTIKDLILGKGVGFEMVNEGDKYDKVIGNIHFTPLSFVLKYGVVFTSAFYIYIFSFLRLKKELISDKFYVTAVLTVFFVFVESFFSYAFFVVPILPVLLGLIKSYNEKNK